MAHHTPASQVDPSIAMVNIVCMAAEWYHWQLPLCDLGSTHMSQPLCMPAWLDFDSMCTMVTAQCPMCAP